MSPDERASAVYAAITSEALPRTYTSGDVMASVTAVWLSGQAVTVVLEATRDGTPVETDNPYSIANPPCSVLVDGELVYDPELAASEIICALVR